MSKPISFGFGKSKTASTGTGTLPSRKPASSKAPSRTALHQDSDNEDEEEPRHESVTGFSSSGAILSRPVQESREKVIQNAGNGDWRRRGRNNLLPAEVQAAQRGDGPVMVERDEVSKATGLQFADKSDKEPEQRPDGDQKPQNHADSPPSRLTADDEALQALLDDGTGKPKSSAVIQLQGNRMLSPRDEEEDFRQDIASRPDSSTLEEYTAMPVEEFGLAMLRGMGQKRRANGEVIDLNPKMDDNSRKQRKQEGFLGIGAKAAPGTDGVELGAWGKADMRKNTKGQGFFTPLMRENKATGERISEDEFQRRLKESKGAKDEDDWRQRRDRNLEKSGRDRDRNGHASGNDDYRDQMNSFSRSGSSRRDKEDDREYSRSRRDRGDDDHETSRSRKDRSKDRSRRGRDKDQNHDSRHRDKYRDRHRDDDRYDSSSSHRSHRDHDRDRDGDRYRERDGDRRHRDG
ncbi:hypothetical protein G647_10130 [Cladophialophora carrionii CBS 160.54]|uniref:Pre-mRNA-splicing factor n=1 Tax=Cladophialophora carrionii CBS 160.54 TaxID=1279043 RepID=V9DK19_9EURO|nr:uncharacterized protein G647_10130 [Cladophialophora carrionii CBS 160.54]ETI27031.1 hypothetical protein G647_10130 [Cladophialophora carrionii CBS 160.54]